MGLIAQRLSAEDLKILQAFADGMAPDEICKKHGLKAESFEQAKKRIMWRLRTSSSIQEQYNGRLNMAHAVAMGFREKDLT